MPNCIVPGCALEGTELHSLEVPGSVHLLCQSHHEYLFRGSPNETDLLLYNRTYNAILDARKAEAKRALAFDVVVPEEAVQPVLAAEVAEKEATDAQEPRQEAAPEGQEAAQEDGWAGADGPG